MALIAVSAWTNIFMLFLIYPLANRLLRNAEIITYNFCYPKQQCCKIFVESPLKQVRKVQSTERIINKKFRCYAPFVLVSMDFLQILGNSVAQQNTRYDCYRRFYKQNLYKLFFTRSLVLNF